LEAVVEAGAGGTLVNHSEHQVPPGTIKKVQSSKFKVHFQIVVCAKTLGQAERLVRLKPDFLAYEPPELIGAQQASVATVQAKTIKKVVEIGKGRNVPVVVGAGIHSAEDVKISLKMGAVGILVSSYVVLAKEQKKALEELAEAFV
jgi:triosephosphate isomerase